MRTRHLVPLSILVLGAPLLAWQAAPPAGRGQAAAPPAISAPNRWLRAVDAWTAGQYPAALADLAALLQSPAAAEYRDRIALLTGELYVTVDVTDDGRNPAISPNGDFVAYETGPASAGVTRIVRVGATATPVAELKGGGAAFDRAGARVVYLRHPDTPEWTAAIRALEGADTQQDRQTAQAAVNFLLGKSDLVVRTLATGAETVVPRPGVLASSPQFSHDGAGVIFIGSEETDLQRSDVYLAPIGGGAIVRLTDQPGHKADVLVAPSGAHVVYTVTGTAPFRQPGAGGGRGGGRGAAGGAAGGDAAGRGAAGGGTAGGGGAAAGAGGQAGGRAGGGGAGRGGGGPNPCGGGGGRGGGGGGTASFGVVDLRARTTRLVTGQGVAMSGDGATLAWQSRDGDVCRLQIAPAASDAPATVASARRLESVALSPDGSRVAYQAMTGVGSSTDWEIFVADRQGAAVRVTRDIQHDLLPRFASNGTLVGMMGEARHRRSHLYDLATGERRRLFANNTIRTISPEYAWELSADGSHLVVQADRDGDTVSTERGIYVVDLTQKVSDADLRARVSRQLADENGLRQRMTRAFAPVEALARRTVAKITPARTYAHEKALGDFDSKHITRPGNAKAIAYLEQMYASFGYTPEVQWFEARQGGGAGGGQQQPIRTANVLATLRGTQNPELIYVVSSHFDSVAGGPGADDDTSGTAALLETARALADTPLPATIVFASFTGEEAGLLGSREFVRQAAQRNWNVVGALNNDMIGWAGEGPRLDNTIRYSNPGIKDVQHGAAFLFTDLITYDAKYYRSTDAQAFYDAWGDIVGGIGSYPVLANPNYHQPSDLIETMSFQQIAETAKVTAATLVYLASSPSRLKDLKATRVPMGTTVNWTASPETGIRSYIVAYGPPADPMRTRVTVTTPRATLPSLPAGTHVAVKAVNARGLEGWDWARVVVR